MMPGTLVSTCNASQLILSILFYSLVNISPEEALKYVGVPEVLILDVRENTEYENGHIPGAWLMPWNSGVLQTRWRELPRDRVILVYCRSGVRSARATQFLNEMGFADLMNMSGGFRSYQELPRAEVETGPYPKSDPGFVDWPLY